MLAVQLSGSVFLTVNLQIQITIHYTFFSVNFCCLPFFCFRLIELLHSSSFQFVIFSCSSITNLVCRNGYFDNRGIAVIRFWVFIFFSNDFSRNEEFIYKLISSLMRRTLNRQIYKVTSLDIHLCFIPKCGKFSIENA